MANSKIETSFQNLVNVIKEKTFSATDGATLQAAVADIQIDITDLGISKIGISQIGMANGVASLDENGRIPDIELPIDLIHTSKIGMANGVASLDENGKIPVEQLPDQESAEYRYNIVTKSTGGTNATVTVNKYVDDVLNSSTDYKYSSVATPVYIDGRFSLGYSNATHKFTMTLLTESTTHTSGYSETWSYSESVDISEVFVASIFGTAAYKNVPESGNADATEVVMGNDTRLSDARNAADVSAWAKAANKPTYTASEVGAIATTAKGAANGVASLGSDGKVPSSQLPDSLTGPLIVTGNPIIIFDDSSSGGTEVIPGNFTIEVSANLSMCTIAYPNLSPDLYELEAGATGAFAVVMDLNGGIIGTAYVTANETKNIAIATEGTYIFRVYSVSSVPSVISADIIDGSGNILRNKLNSSDISAWAKASTKPSYGISEITGITSQTTDPGAGSALTTGNIIFVYDA